MREVIWPFCQSIPDAVIAVVVVVISAAGLELARRGYVVWAWVLKYQWHPQAEACKYCGFFHQPGIDDDE